MPTPDDFAVDPSTGLPNLFSLIEEEVPRIADFIGTAIVMDLVGLHRINTELDTAVGDVCVQMAARFIQTRVVSLKGRVYRSGGDEFIALVPGVGRAQCEELVRAIRDDYAEAMRSFGVTDADIRYELIGYPDQDRSLISLLMPEGVTRLHAEADPGHISEPILSVLDRMIGLTRQSITLVRDAWDVALTDATSGLPNSRAGEACLEEGLAGFSRHGRPFSILLVDGDRLKKYNSALGYQAGNEMIRNLGELIVGAVRSGNFVARWLMGDEFLVVLRRASRNVAYGVSERIRRAVMEGSKVWPLPITVSIGVASCPEDGRTSKTLVEAAEKANGAAKLAGRNRVV